MFDNFTEANRFILHFAFFVCNLSRLSSICTEFLPGPARRLHCSNIEGTRELITEMEKRMGSRFVPQLEPIQTASENRNALIQNFLFILHI